MTLWHLSLRDNPRHGPQRSRNTEHPHLLYQPCTASRGGGGLQGSTAGYQDGGRESGGGWCARKAFHASVWLVPSPQEVGRRQKCSLTPEELIPWPSRQARPGPGGAGSQPRGQDLQEGGTVLHDRQAEGSRGAESGPCFLPGRALGSQQSRQAGPCRGDQTGGRPHRCPPRPALPSPPPGLDTLSARPALGFLPISAQKSPRWRGRP